MAYQRRVGAPGPAGSRGSSFDAGDARSCEGGQGVRRTPAGDVRRSPAGEARSNGGGQGARGARLVKQMQLTSSAELESS